MTVNDGLPFDESAAYDVGHTDAPDSPTELLPLPTMTPPDTVPTEALELPKVDAPAADAPAIEAPAESTTDGSVAGDLFDGAPDPRPTGA